MIGQSHNAVFVCAPPVVTYRMSLAAERLHHVRTYGQLEGEIEQDAWILEPASPEDPFRAGDLWGYLLGRRGGEYAFLARMPEDPSMN